MPICTRDGLNITPSSPPENLKDDDEVFFCETTKEIFRDYKEYFQRIMLINSTIWACELTGREDLTYAEALKSERKARKIARSFKEALRAPVLLAIKKAQQSSHNMLLNNIYQFLKDRYFRGEIIISSIKNSKLFDSKILDVLPPEQKPDNGIYSSSDLKYRVQILNSKDTDEIHIVSSSDIRRRQTDLTHKNLQFFIKCSTEFSSDGIIKPKFDVYKKYVTEPHITFESLFVGNLPEWKPSKPRKVINGKGSPDNEKNKENINEITKERRQETLSKYLVKRNGDNFKVSREDKEVERALKERLEKLQKLKEEEQAELERKRLAQQKKADKKWLNISTVCDDLERFDQKPLPSFNAVKTIFPLKYFGDLLHIMEFIQSYSQLTTSNPFKNNISFFEMCRAFTQPEVAGPLSNILIHLLNTVFSLQYEEEEECSVEYIMNPTRRGRRADLASAAYTHRFVEKHYSSKLIKLPVDAISISEILRLHLLGSGATTDDKSERWRFNYRNGYDVSEDPGLALRLEQPHILRALKQYTFYELPLSDIVKILNCLINQILTYSGSINLIEERLEAVAELRKNIRALQTAENKRNAFVSNEKRRIALELLMKMTDVHADGDKKSEIQEDINDQQKRIDLADEREKTKFLSEFNSLQSNLFDYLLYLGSDRAYRNYYIFESLPGIFIEHSTECYDVCLDNPPKNDYQIANWPHSRREMKTFLLKEVIQEENENGKISLKLNGEANKENCTVTNNCEIPKVNGTATLIPVIGEVKPSLPTAYDLMMCTGDPHHCIVHDVTNPDRKQWSFIHTEEELEELINSLNPFGIRESTLRKEIINAKSLIIDHIKKCPADLFSIDESTEGEFLEKIKSETLKKYRDPNLGYTTSINISEIMDAIITDEILDFEYNITTGGLGKLKVKNLDQWRTDIKNNSYNPQCQKLIYGKDVEDRTYKEPGTDLGDLIDTELENNLQGDSVHYSTETLRTIQNLASALLQIEQGIEQRFLKEPFGLKSNKATDVDEKLKDCKKKLQNWEISLMASTSFSQVYLHKLVLFDAVKWNESAIKARCSICNRKGDATQFLLCDNCNAGTHMYCLKPKLTEIPEGDWYCKICEKQKKEEKKIKEKKRRRPRKKVFQVDEDDEEVVEIKEFGGDVYSKRIHEFTKDTSYSSCNERTCCFSCFEDEPEIECKTCKNWYHLQCTYLKRAPRRNWICGLCRMKDQKRRVIESDKESVDSDELFSKRTKRNRIVISDEESDLSEPKRPRRSMTKKCGSLNHRRSARLDPDELPLQNAVLYELLDDIMKHESAWPFIRPVSQNELPDYYEIIKKPMDFAKIKSNLNEGYYKKNEEVMKDIELVFRNCDVYNTQGNDIYNAGVSLEGFVIKRCEQLNLPFTASDMLADSTDN